MESNSRELQKLASLFCKVHNLYYETERGTLKTLFSKDKDQELKEIFEDIKLDIINIFELKRPTKGNKIFSEMHPEKLQETDILKILD